MEGRHHRIRNQSAQVERNVSWKNEKIGRRDLEIICKGAGAQDAENPLQVCALLMSARSTKIATVATKK
jgi:hypothetical protein